MSTRLLGILGGSILTITLLQPGSFAWGKDADKNTTTITGCLAQGDETNEFSIKGDDGKVYGLRSSTIKLSEHLNHKVTVTGKVTPEKHAGKIESKTGRPEEDAHMRVSSLEMVSASCN